MKRGNARLFTLLAVIIVLSLVVDLFSLNVLYNIAESKSDLSGELASLWSGNPVEKINSVKVSSSQCLKSNITSKSSCLKAEYCLCDELYNQCYSLTTKYRDQDFATCRSKTFPATINGKYFKTLADCENAVISATYTDRNNCKSMFGWVGSVNYCYNSFNNLCKEVFLY